jgi:hypothetical protein
MFQCAANSPANASANAASNAVASNGYRCADAFAHSCASDAASDSGAHSDSVANARHHRSTDACAYAAADSAWLSVQSQQSSRAGRVV